MCKLYHILIILFLTGIAVTIYGCSGKDSQNVRTVREQKSESVSQAVQTAPLASEGKHEGEGMCRGGSWIHNALDCVSHFRHKSLTTLCI